jgi:hypothetical protein
MLGFFDVIEGGDEHKICGVRALKLSFNCSSAIAHCPIRAFSNGAPGYFIGLPLHRFRSFGANKRVRCAGGGGPRLSHGISGGNASSHQITINHVFHGYSKRRTNINPVERWNANKSFYRVEEILK